MNHKVKIVVIEDEEGIRDFIKVILMAHDYEVILCSNGVDGLDAISKHHPDVVLLDLGLPDIDGLDVLKAFRSWSELPLIVISSRNNEKEKVEALDLGADDYITKPFGTDELLARIRTALRHLKAKQSPDMQTHLFVERDLKIDYDKRLVYLKDEIIHMTPIEYRLLVMLSQNIGKVLTYDALMRSIWGPYVDERQSLRVNMANIRRKIEADTTNIKYIKTEVGIGYRMLTE